MSVSLMCLAVLHNFLSTVFHMCLSWHVLFPCEDVHTHIIYVHVHVCIHSAYEIPLGFRMDTVEVQMTVWACSLRQFIYRTYTLHVDLNPVLEIQNSTQSHTNCICRML
jgi:hypothetical protein